MTIYIQIKDNKVVASTDNIKIAQSVFENYIETEFEDYTPNNIKYTFDGEKIILNADYESIIEQQAKEQRKAEILEQLDALDLKSIRALRTGETDRLEELEKQAIKLRDELRSL